MPTPRTYKVLLVIHEVVRYVVETDADDEDTAREQADELARDLYADSIPPDKILDGYVETEDIDEIDIVTVP